MAELDTTRLDVLDHLAARGRRARRRGIPLPEARLHLLGRDARSLRRPHAHARRTGARRLRRGAPRRGRRRVHPRRAARRSARSSGSSTRCASAPTSHPGGRAPPGQGELQPGYEDTTPSTRNAFVNTCTRSFMHRRLWSNDPDCVMLRTDDTQLDPAAARRVGRDRRRARAGSCSSPTTSTRLGRDAGALLDDVVERGRAADAAARAGDLPRCNGLLDPAGPAGLEGPAGRVRVDLENGNGGLA